MQKKKTLRGSVSSNANFLRIPIFLIDFPYPFPVPTLIRKKSLNRLPVNRKSLLTFYHVQNFFYEINEFF